MATTSLDGTMGSLYIGVTLAMGLWGASSVQLYYYYDRYPKEELWIKLLVFLVWALDTTHQGLISHSVYKYLITEYGNAAYLMSLEITLLVEVLFNALVVALVQSFFILRIWRLSHNTILVCAALGFQVLASFTLSCIFVYKSLRMDSFQELPKLNALNYAINVLGVLVDMGIALILIWLLQRSRTGFKRSDTIITRLIMFSMNTGLITGLNAIATLVSNVVAGNTFLYILFYVNTSRLYTNSLLAALNSRKGMHAVDESSYEQPISLGQSRLRSRALEIDSPGTVKSNQHALSIKVNTETETMRDAEDGNVEHGTSSKNDMSIVYGYDDSK